MNDVNRCLVATSLLGNSGYQTDRKICDQSKIALRLRSSRDPSETMLLACFHDEKIK